MEQLKKIYRRVDERVSQNLNQLGIKVRSNASHGLRLCVYLPLCLPESRPLLLVPALSSFLSPTPTLHPKTVLLTILQVTLTYCIFGFTSTNGLLPVLGFTLLYPHCLLYLLGNCPASFSLGEASVVTQGIMLFLYKTFHNIHTSLHNIPTTEYDIITLILQVGILCVLLIMYTVYHLHSSMDLRTFTAVVGFYVGMLLIALQYLLGQNPVTWIIMFLIHNTTRLYLLFTWLLLSALGVLCVCGQIFSGSRASSPHRKVFHLLCTAVYLLGYLHDLFLIYLASGVALAVLLALETIRKLNLGQFSVMLNEGFIVFADEKDADISLTPLYLLVGLSLPLALSTPPYPSPLHCLGGVLSIGVGDTFASFVGTHWGRNKWPGSNKSIEGTIGSVLSQLLTLLALIYSGFIPSSARVLLVSSAAIVTNAMEEAFTDQVDNLSLPLITSYILQFS